MATQWTGRIFVYTDDYGQQYVATTLLEGAVIPASHVRTYRSVGPRMPMGVPQAIAVDDADQWIGERKNEGFTFQLIDQ
jgi:hypothetical protein